MAIQLELPGQSGAGRIVRAAAMAASLLLPIPGAAQGSVAYVLVARGTWFAGSNPGDRLTAGVALLAGDTIHSTPRSEAGDHLTVVLRAGDAITLECPAEGEGHCDESAVIPDRREATLFGRFVDKVMEGLRGEPTRYTSLVSRGALGPADAVLLVRGDALDVAPALAPLNSGEYNLCLTRPPRAGATADNGCPYGARVHWSGDDAVAARLRGLTPGLYEFAVRSPEGVVVGTPAWVVVSDSVRFPQIRSTFDSARALTRRWSDRVQPGDIRTFLRSALDALAPER